MNVYRILAVLLLLAVALGGCQSQADVASSNLSVEADNFKITRHFWVLNALTGEELISVTGKCSLGNFDTEQRMSVTCKIGEDKYGNGIFYKHFVGLSPAVIYIAEQIEGSEVDPYHHEVIVRPAGVIPDLRLDLPGSTDGGDND